MKRSHVVIVGAGFGGLAAARALAGAPVDVTVVDRNNYHLFQPLLYQVATAALSPAQIATPIRSIVRRQKNVEVLMAEVRSIDPAKRRLILDDAGLEAGAPEERTLPYDMLVVATGSRPAYFGHDAWERFATGLKSVEDAIEIRGAILRSFELAERETDPAIRKELLTFVCIGGGPTGVEMAGAIVEIARAALAKEYRHIDPKSARVVLIESGPRILASFAESLSAAAHRRLEKMGVEIRTGSPVEDVTERGVVLRAESIASRTVVWAAGVAATPVADWLGVPTSKGGRVAVQGDLSVPGRPEVFVIGDAAHCEQEGRPLPGVAPVAKQQGDYVARVIRSRAAGTAAPPPFRYRDKGNLATVGRSFAVVEMRRMRLAGFFAWVAWLGVHIFYLIGFRNRLLVLLEWAWAYFTFQRSARIISSRTSRSRG